MAEQVVGIDIGERTVKAVQVTKSFKKGLRVTAAAVIDIAGAGGLDGAMKELFEDRNFLQGRCVVNFPARDVSFRQVRLPFTQRKKIEQTISFEVESMIPYAIEDVFVDYCVTAHQTHADILTAIVPKSHMDEWITRFLTLGRTVDVIDVDGISVLSNLMAYQGIKGAGIFLDIGAKNTTGVFFHDGHKIQVRHFAHGGESISETLATDSTDRTLEGLFSELKKTMDFLAWNGELPENPAVIFLTGGGSLNEDIRKSLAKYFSLPVTAIDIAASVPIHIDEKYRETWSSPVMNQALALALRFNRRVTGFNFRRLIIAGKDRFKGAKKNLKWIAAALAIFLVLGAVEFYLDYALTKARVARLKGDVSAVFKQNAPDVTRIVEPVQQLKTKIAEAKKVTQNLREATSGVTALDVLRDISVLTPPTAGFIITSFNYDNVQVIIKGEASNYDAVDAIKRELGRSKYFSGVTISSSNTMKQDNKVEFEMRATIRKQA
jgi:general secretion pathway protein L